MESLITLSACLSIQGLGVRPHQNVKEIAPHVDEHRHDMYPAFLYFWHCYFLYKSSRSARKNGRGPRGPHLDVQETCCGKTHRLVHRITAVARTLKPFWHPVSLAFQRCSNVDRGYPASRRGQPNARHGVFTFIPAGPRSCWCRLGLKRTRLSRARP